MIELIKHGTSIDFVGKIKYVTTASIILTIISVYGIVYKMNYGVDFRGGAEIQTKFSQTVMLDDLRSALDNGGFKGVSVQSIGEASENEVLIKVQAEEGSLNLITENITKSLSTSFPGNNALIEKVDIVGPKAGSELRFSGIMAMFWAIISIMIYVAVRFDFRYAPGIMISLVHDMVIVCGVLAFVGTEFSLQTIAALLAIIGYSVNDTVVVYDRIREYESRDPSKTLAMHVNDAVNDTLSRTVLTSVATLLVSISMFLFGGGAIKDFFFALTVGILFGSYSSVFVAAAATLLFDNISKKFTSGKNGQHANKVTI